LISKGWARNPSIPKITVSVFPGILGLPATQQE
jgi:hypothetical protein